MRRCTKWKACGIKAKLTKWTIRDIQSIADIVPREYDPPQLTPHFPGGLQPCLFVQVALPPARVFKQVDPAAGERPRVFVDI